MRCRTPKTPFTHKKDPSLMPVLFLLEVYYDGISDHCTCQSASLVVTTIMCIRGSGWRHRAMPVPEPQGDVFPPLAS